MTDRRRARETPRILYVENVGWGFLTHRVAFALAARAAGYDVHVATDLEHDSERDRIEALGFTFHRLSLARGVAGPGRELRTMWDLAALYRSLRPDIVHQITIKPVIYGTFVARFVPSIAVVNTVSGLGHLYVNDDRRSRLLRGFSNLGYRSAFARGKSRTIFQNADDLARFPGVVRPLVIEGAGVDLTAFAPSEEPPGEITVVLPARMLREKGVIEFAEAARSLRAAGVRARFQLAGIPDLANPGSLTERDLERLERDCGVEWLGYQADMAAVFRSCHIVCLPSAYGEGIPKALLEAAGCARPIVTTDMPGCRHVVAHGRNGLLVPPRDAQAVANALRLLIDDKTRRMRFGEQGRAIAEARFDVKRVTAETLTVYAALLEKSYFSATTAAM